MGFATSPVLLVNCPFGHLESPFLGLARVASFLNAWGTRAEVLDLNIELFHHLGQPEIWNQPPIYSEKSKLERRRELFADFLDHHVARILAAGYALIGLSVHRYNMLLVNEIAQRVDEALGCPVVIGGPSIQLPGERRFLYDSPNIILVEGRGEPVLPALLADLRRGQPKHRYFEVDYPEPARSSITTFAEFNLDRYLWRSLPVSFNQGCRGRCAFCDEKYQFKTLEGDVARLIEEIRFYVGGLGVRRFEFTDQAINAFPSALKQLCHELVEHPLEIGWNSNAISNRFFTSANCALLKQSGCEFLRFGIETGSPSVLAKMRKPFSVEMAQQALAHCTAHGIGTHLNIMVGFPGEEEDDFQQTLRFLSRNKASITRVDNVFTCYATPRSEIETHADRYGIVLPSVDHAFRWHTADGRNTLETRLKRNDLLIQHLRQEEIPFGVPDIERVKHHLEGKDGAQPGR